MNLTVTLEIQKFKFTNFLKSYITSVKPVYLIICVIMFITLTAVSIYLKKKHNTENIKLFTITILPVYLFAVYSSLVFSRVAYPTYNYSLIPFYSYYQTIKGIEKLAMEIIGNIIMLMPVGILLPFNLKKNKFKTTLIIGFLITFSIEFMQLIFKKGLFETDDLIDNTLGVVLGYLIYKIICSVIEKHKRKAD